MVRLALEAGAESDARCVPKQDLANARSGAWGLTLCSRFAAFDTSVISGLVGLLGIPGSTPSNEFDASLSLRGSGLGS